jgi:D-apionolactonase
MKLYAGTVEVEYENGFLRYVLCEGAEVLRMMYFALRDENWGTYVPFIENEIIKKEQNAFHIEYDCFHYKNEIPIFKWHAILRGEENGRITFAIKGEALQDVLKNRAGFCVLHPIHSCSGQPIEILQNDGEISTAIFPINIAPHNPFKNIKQIRWKIDRWYGLSFEGDAFETEDQRNWTDASYKTFCTPLALPFPVLLKKGSNVQQCIVFKPETLPKQNVAAEISIHVSERKIKFPSIGISDCVFPDAIKDRIRELIAKLKLSHYRVEVTFNDTWVSDFSDACVRAAGLHLPLEVVLHLSDDFKNEIHIFSTVVAQNRLILKSVILLHTSSVTTPLSLIDFISQIKEYLPTVEIGIGTDFNFAELNRNAFAPGDADFITYSIHPQEHAFDDASLIENLEAQHDTVISANVLFPQHAIQVSPVTLRRRYNPYATDPKGRNILGAQRADHRQSTLFGAVWTLGSLKQLTKGMAVSITLFEVIGLLGIISAEGNPFPIYDALQNLFSIQSDFVYDSQSTCPLKVDGFFFTMNRALLWNYTQEEQNVFLPNRRVIKLAPHEIKIMMQ